MVGKPTTSDNATKISDAAFRTSTACRERPFKLSYSRMRAYAPYLKEKGDESTEDFVGNNIGSEFHEVSEHYLGKLQ